MQHLIDSHTLDHNNYYEDTDYVSNSMLNLLDKSPAYFRYVMDHPIRPTQAMKFGSAFHMNVLQPNEFQKEYAISPKFDKRTKIGKEKFAEFQSENINKKVITESDYEIMEQMTSKIYRESLTKELLTNGESEKIIVWQNQQFNVNCKGMIDYFREKNGILIDLKTTQDSSYHAFKRTIQKYNYHKQAAFYCDALAAHEFYIIAIEKTPPYLLNVFQIGEKLLDEGRQMYKRQLEIYVNCVENNYWPDYGYDFYNSDSVREVQLIDIDTI